MFVWKITRKEGIRRTLVCKSRIQVRNLCRFAMCEASQMKSGVYIALCDTPVLSLIQCRLFIPAPINRTSASASLYKHQWITSQKISTGTSMIYVACESRPRSVVRSGNSGRMPRKLGGNLACGRILYTLYSIMLGLSRHLVLELNDGTV